MALFGFGKKKAKETPAQQPAAPAQPVPETPAAAPQPAVPPEPTKLEQLQSTMEITVASMQTRAISPEDKKRYCDRFALLRDKLAGITPVGSADEVCGAMNNAMMSFSNYFILPDEEEIGKAFAAFDSAVAACNGADDSLRVTAILQLQVVFLFGQKVIKDYMQREIGRHIEENESRKRAIASTRSADEMSEAEMAEFGRLNQEIRSWTDKKRANESALLGIETRLSAVQNELWEMQLNPFSFRLSDVLREIREYTEALHPVADEIAEIRRVAEEVQIDMANERARHNLMQETLDSTTPVTLPEDLAEFEQLREQLTGAAAEAAPAQAQAAPAESRAAADPDALLDKLGGLVSEET